MLMLALAERGDRYGDHDGGPFFFLLFLTLLGVGIYFLVRWIRRRRGLDAPQGPSAMNVLEDRFARGDIDRHEFEHRKAVLSGSDVVPPAPAGGTATATRPAPPQPPGFADAAPAETTDSPDPDVTGDAQDGDTDEDGPQR